MDERIVINTGPLVTLSRIDALDLIAQLPFRFVCPQEVRDELDDGEKSGYTRISPIWLNIESLRSSPSPLIVSTLGRGEAAVIQLALEQGIKRVCIDEWKGRRAAIVAGLRVTGVLGLLGRAKQQGIIPLIRPLVEKATKEGIRYHPDLVKRVLQAAAEL